MEVILAQLGLLILQYGLAAAQANAAKNDAERNEHLQAMDSLIDQINELHIQLPQGT